MPHIIVKIVNQSEESKKNISEALVYALSKTMGISDELISLSIEDVLKENWIEDVYNPDIIEKPDNLYKRPGYDPA